MSLAILDTHFDVIWSLVIRDVLQSGFCVVGSRACCASNIWRGTLMKSSLRAPFLKALLVGGALLVAWVAFAREGATAGPVVSGWYGPGFEGAITASGEPFDPYGSSTAAS